MIKAFIKFLIKRNENNQLSLLEAVAKKIYPSYIFNDFGRIYLEDSFFRSTYLKFDSRNMRSYDRKYLVWQFLDHIINIDGDTAECGAYKGATSWFICDKIKNTNKTHHIFDSFEGVSEPDKNDGSFWKKGNLSATEEELRKNLVMYLDNIKIYKGWIPETFANVESQVFSFVHIDVDLYQPTEDSLKFFYPMLSKGGIIICDDYGFSTCPGAKKAIDDFFIDKPENIINLPTGQCLIIKI